MAFARDTYTASASQTNFTITFPYLDSDHIVLTIDTVASTDFTLSDATTLVLDTPATGGEAIVISRDTPNSSLVSFADGAPVTQANMETFRKQVTYLVEELSDYVDVVTA